MTDEKGGRPMEIEKTTRQYNNLHRYKDTVENCPNGKQCSKCDLDHKMQHCRSKGYVSKDYEMRQLDKRLECIRNRKGRVQ